MAIFVYLLVFQFSQMIKLYHSLGPEKFPLNEQTFYPNHTQMVSDSIGSHNSIQQNERSMPAVVWSIFH